MLLDHFFCATEGLKCALFLRENTVYKIGNEDYDKQIKVRHSFLCFLSVLHTRIERPCENPTRVMQSFVKFTGV